MFCTINFKGNTTRKTNKCTSQSEILKKVLLYLIPPFFNGHVVKGSTLLISVQAKSAANEKIGFGLPSI